MNDVGTMMECQAAVNLLMLHQKEDYMLRVILNNRVMMMSKVGCLEQRMSMEIPDRVGYYHAIQNGAQF